ncbi:MAG TPA: polysaccharide biosynthesis tyrosine autokinase [Acidobacteriota bacterium]|jgi:capsular exopolysaccharide synthesis family protein
MAQIDVNLRDLYRVLRKRRWIIMISPLLMGLATFAVTEAPVPIYEASALVRISRSSTLAGLMVDIVNYGAYDNMATQIVVVKSQPILEEVAYRLNMVKGHNPKQAVDELKGKISASQQENSDILEVRATSESREEAIALANTTAEIYIKHSADEKTRRLDEMVEFIRGQAHEINNEVGRAERDLNNFRRLNAVNLALNPAQSADIRERRIQYERRVQDIRAAVALLAPIQRSKDYETLVQTYIQVDDPALRYMAEDVAKRAANVVELRSRKADLLKYQTTASPQVTATAAKLELEEQRVNSQLNSLIGRLRSLLAEYERLDGILARQESEFARQPQVYAQIEDLQNVIREKGELASNLRKRLQEAEIKQKEKTEDIVFVERAHSAVEIRPKNRIYQALIGAVIGLLLGGVFAFVIESLDTSIGTIEDVEQYIASSVVGVVPHIELEEIKARLREEFTSPNVLEEDLDQFARLTTHFDPKSVASEAYRSMRTNISSLMEKTNAKVLMITSSVLQEGKTTSLSNLATVFAQSGRRTLLIDADLRRPHVDKVFGLDKTPGLSDILLGTREPKDCYRTIGDLMLGKYGLRMAQVTPGLEYLSLLLAGRQVDNPAELLNSSAIDKLISEARASFDVVLIDSSPVLPVADPSILAPKVDGVVLSYQIGRIGRDVLKRSKLRLEGLGARIWGVIMNDIQAEIDYRRGDYHYYRYRYDTEVQPGWLDRIKSRFNGSKTRVTPSIITSRPVPPSAPPVGPPQPEIRPPDRDRALRDLMGLTDDEEE